MDARRKVKLGQKWTCYSCQQKFYDLNKPDPHCPKCGADQRQSPAFEKPKRARGKKAAAQPPPPKKAVKPPPPIDESEEVDETPIDTEDLEFDDIELEEGDRATAEVEEPEEDAGFDDDED